MEGAWLVDVYVVGGLAFGHPVVVFVAGAYIENHLVARANEGVHADECFDFLADVYIDGVVSETAVLIDIDPIPTGAGYGNLLGGISGAPDEGFSGIACIEDGILTVAKSDIGTDIDCRSYIYRESDGVVCNAVAVAYFYPIGSGCGNAQSGVGGAIRPEIIAVCIIGV